VLQAAGQEARGQPPGLYSQPETRFLDATNALSRLSPELYQEYVAAHPVFNRMPEWANSPYQPAPGSAAYQAELTRLLVQEANRVARDLDLPEQTPITEANAIEVEPCPLGFAKRLKAVGKLVTRNYIYQVGVGYKFSFLTRTRLKEEDDQLKATYLEPIGQLDTNGALKLATQFLARASMDVAALGSNCEAQVRAERDSRDKQHFVPLYTITWKERAGSETPHFDAATGRLIVGTKAAVASVELFLPTKSLRQLRVIKSEYILRPPLEITNSDFLNLPDSPPARSLQDFVRPPPPK
jgi:hypothetical protein